MPQTAIRYQFVQNIKEIVREDLGLSMARLTEELGLSASTIKKNLARAKHADQGRGMRADIAREFASRYARKRKSTIQTEMKRLFVVLPTRHYDLPKQEPPQVAAEIEPDRLYTTAEAAQYLHVQRDSVKQYIWRGGLKAEKQLRQWVIRGSDLIAFRALTEARKDQYRATEEGG